MMRGKSQFLSHQKSNSNLYFFFLFLPLNLDMYIKSIMSSSIETGYIKYTLRSAE